MNSAVFTRKLHNAGTIALVSSLALGCATNAENGALIGGTIACTVAVVLSGSGSKGDACAKGAAVGVAVGYWLGLQKDARDAQLAAQKIKNNASSDVRVTVKTRTTAVPKEAQSGELANTQAVEVLDEFVVSVPTNRLANGDADVSATLKQVGGYVSTSSQPVSVRISSSTQSDFSKAVNLIQTGYPTKTSPEKVKYGYAEDARSRFTIVKVGQPS